MPCLPCTPKIPMPIKDLPVCVCARHLSDNQIGMPVRSSRSIAPRDHMSYDHGSCMLHKLVEFIPLADVFAPRFSRYSSTSGAKYSGVDALMLDGVSYEKAEPKSISLMSFTYRPSKSIRMLSGLMSACTILNIASTSKTCESCLISPLMTLLSYLRAL